MARPPNAIPAAQRRALLAAARRADTAAAELKAAVRDAHAAGGSVRIIAAVLDRSPTTIQAWIKSAD